MRLDELGERGMIDVLTSLLGSGQGVVRGIGDDAAVVRAGDSDFVLTSDPVIEQVHFSMDDAPERIGHKAVGRVLSDIAAMGGRPLWLLINVVAPGRVESSFLEAVYRGAGALLDVFGASVVGGDVAEGRQFELHVFGVGAVPEGTAVLRSGAVVGDRIFATGRFGGSLAGKHLDFTPRVREGIWLREGRWVSAMIDVSDGLYSELCHVAGSSGVDVVLDTACVPVSAACAQMPGERTALEHALFDGEDFELLFTVPKERADELMTRWADLFDVELSCVGYVVGEGAGNVTDVNGCAIAAGSQDGFEHFKPQNRQGK